jgi:non-specific serine/threonine protein kinase
LSEICNELEGIPLAIELAASRLQVLSLQEIVDLLGDRFRLLAGGNRLAHPRHQSLRALIDWSYNLLTPAERDLLKLLSVFENDWTLEDVERIHAGKVRAGTVGGSDVLDLLTQLVKKSFVMIDDHAAPVRYHMFKSVRLYAQERAQEAA